MRNSTTLYVVIKGGWRRGREMKNKKEQTVIIKLTYVIRWLECSFSERRNKQEANKSKRNKYIHRLQLVIQI